MGMMNEDDMHDEADQKILEEILEMMSNHMGSKVKPKAVSIDMMAAKPEEDEGAEHDEGSPLEELADALEGEKDGEHDEEMKAHDPMMEAGKDLDSPLDMDGLEDALHGKDRADGEDDSDDEYSLRRRGKIF